MKFPCLVAVALSTTEPGKLVQFYVGNEIQTRTYQSPSTLSSVHPEFDVRAHFPFYCCYTDHVLQWWMAAHARSTVQGAPAVVMCTIQMCRKELLRFFAPKIDSQIFANWGYAYNHFALHYTGRVWHWRPVALPWLTVWCARRVIICRGLIFKQIYCIFLGKKTDLHFFCMLGVIIWSLCIGSWQPLAV